MHATDYLINLLIAGVLIVGGYQFYFFSQRWRLYGPYELELKIDNWIPFWPSWIWVYSVLFYLVILSTVLTIDSFARFNYTAFNFIALLGMQMIAFAVFPTHTPEKWRQFDANTSLSARLPALVQRYDARTCTFPSIHVSIATLTSIHLFYNLGPAIGDYAALSFLFHPSEV